MRIIAFITNSRLVAKILEHFREQTSRAPPKMPTGPVSSFSDFDDTNSQQAEVPWHLDLPAGSTIERGSESCALSDHVSKFREGSTAVEELFSESFVGI